MAQETVERFRRGLEAWNSGDIEGVLDLFHPDIEYDDSQRLIEPAVYRGRDEVRRHFVSNLLEAWEKLEIDVEEIIDLDDKLVSVLHMQGRGKASGMDVDARIALVWTIRDGLAVRMQYFGEREEALKAAGEPGGSAA